MARRRKKAKRGERPGQRVALPQVTLPTLRPKVLLSRVRRTRRPVIIGDRRLLATRLRPPVRSGFEATRLVVAPAERARPRRKSGVSPFFVFKGPKGVMVCVRRKERREVLFAGGRAGKGIRVRARRRRNEYSDVRCR